MKKAKSGCLFPSSRKEAELLGRAYGKHRADGTKYEACRRAKRKWAKNNPNKTRAHLSVFRALRRGLLNKLPCKICGGKIVEAHHKNGYTDQLNIVWYCPLHHRQKHGQE